MINLGVVCVTFLSTIVPIHAAGMLPGGQILSVSNNCSSDSQPCGPAPSCCAPGLICNFRRGIPICSTGKDQVISGFDHEPCADPYLFRCDITLGISGFCCPIGTSCRALQSDKIVHCIDALGTTALALPSATTGLVPTATPILGSDPSIVYSPSDAWNISNTDANCSTSKSLHVTNAINATVSINFTGPSIMVRTITSSNGGVFSVWFDGFNTSTIDTSSQHGNYSLPACYPLQFPPFAATPPGFESHTNHTLTLIYVGASSYSPEGAGVSTVQFDSFAIPDLDLRLTTTNGDSPAHAPNFHILLFLSSLFLYPMF